MDSPPLTASVCRAIGMTLEILSIGNELLSGHTVNTNGALIAQTLFSSGFSASRLTLLPDEKNSLKGRG